MVLVRHLFTSAICAVGALAAFPSQAAFTLEALGGGAPATGTGLSGTWYKVDDNARFSNYVFEGQRIGDQPWGTGIWSVSGDFAQITAPSSPLVLATTTSVGAVSYANTIYNDTYLSGTYGVWSKDYVRPLAPIVSVPSSCTGTDCAQQNYAAVFSGYIYVESAGLYDFGVFSDDGFAFKLQGAGGSFLSMGLDSVAGSPGRVSYSLTDSNALSDGLFLQQGYYGISLDYFNREQAGVIDLGWKRAGEEFHSVGSESLFAQSPSPVDEPSALWLLALGSAVVMGAARRRAHAVGNVAALQAA